MARFNADQCRVMAWVDHNEFSDMNRIVQAFPDLGKQRIVSALRSLQRRGLVYCYRGYGHTGDPENSWGRGCYATWAGDHRDDPVVAGHKEWLIATAKELEAA